MRPPPRHPRRIGPRFGPAESALQRQGQHEHSGCAHEWNILGSHTRPLPTSTHPWGQEGEGVYDTNRQALRARKRNAWPHPPSRRTQSCAPAGPLRKKSGRSERIVPALHRWPSLGEDWHVMKLFRPETRFPKRQNREHRLYSGVLAGWQPKTTTRHADKLTKYHLHTTGQGPREGRDKQPTPTPPREDNKTERRYHSTTRTQDSGPERIRIVGRSNGALTRSTAGAKNARFGTACSIIKASMTDTCVWAWVCVCVCVSRRGPKAPWVQARTPWAIECGRRPGTGEGASHLGLSPPRPPRPLLSDTA